MSFAEVVTDRASDVEVTADGLIYAVKLVMVMTAKDGDHAGQALRNISHSLFDSRKFSERQMSTHGGAPTKLLSLQDATISFAEIVTDRDPVVKVTADKLINAVDLVMANLRGDLNS
jgi:hypothetical protein